MGLHCRPRYRVRGGLLPHHFTLTVSHIATLAVCFLVHFPSAYAARELPVILPCVVLTFLTRSSKYDLARPHYPPNRYLNIPVHTIPRDIRAI